MAEHISVLLADDVAETRLNIRKLMSFYPNMEVVAEAGTAEEALQSARQLKPDLILMDINMPGMDGIKATEILARELPDTSIIIISVQNEKEYLRQAMIAGAKNYLTKPFTADELISAIQKTAENRRNYRNRPSPAAECEGKVITVFSTKGGIGKTTIATNLAVSLAEKTSQQVCVLDADLQFGDVALFLNITPQATIADLVQDMEHLADNLREGYLSKYSKNLKVLPAPLRPEQADNITSVHLTEIIKTMRRMFQYIVIDTAPMFSDTMLTALDAADEILVISSLDLPTIKNVKLCLEIMDSLHYSQEKTKLVLNRADADTGINVSEVEESLGRKFAALLPSDGRTVVASVNRGVPFVCSNPDTVIAKCMYELAGKIATEPLEPEQNVKRGFMSKVKTFFDR